MERGKKGLISLLPKKKGREERKVLSWGKWEKQKTERFNLVASKFQKKKKGKSRERFNLEKIEKKTHITNSPKRKKRESGEKGFILRKLRKTKDRKV